MRKFVFWRITVRFNVLYVSKAVCRGERALSHPIMRIACFMNEQDPESFPFEIMQQGIDTLRSNMVVTSQIFRWAAIGRGVLAAISAAEAVSIKRISGLYCVKIMPGGEASAEDLHDALKIICGQEPLRVCAGQCGQPKAITSFSKLARSKDGRNYVCLECERERLKQHRMSKVGRAHRAKTSAN